MAASEDNGSVDLAPVFSWKVFTAGIGFAVFGLGGVVLSLTVFPLIYMTPLSQTRRQRISRRLLSWLFRRYVRMMEILGLIKLELRGSQYLQNEGQLLVANHPSLLDVVYLISLVNNATSLVKQSMWSNPFTAGTVLATHYVRNDADDPIKDCAEALVAGDSLIIFPEGTRTQLGKPYTFLRGAANIALLAQQDITPVTIHSNPSGLKKGQPWYRTPRQTLQITIECFPPMPIAPYLQSGEVRSKLARQLTRDLEDFYRQHSPS